MVYADWKGLRSALDVRCWRVCDLTIFSVSLDMTERLEIGR